MAKAGEPGTPERDAARVRILPPVVPLTVVVAGWGLDRLWPIDPGVVLPAPARYWIGGALAVAAFLVLAVWPILLMHRHGQSAEPWKPTTAVVETGPYRLSRNPMYLAMVLGCIGVAVATWNVWMLALSFAGAWALQRFAILPEEDYLGRKFGGSYRAYRERVRRWI